MIDSIQHHRPLRVLVVGAGAIGGFYGAVLARQGVEVSVVCRSDYDAVRRQGFRIASTLGDLSYRPARVLRSVADYDAAPDCILLCAKVVDDLDRAALVRPAMGPETALVLIENGVEIEAPLAEAFPGNTLVSGIAFVAVSRLGEGRIEHKAYGNLVLGDYPNGEGTAVQTLAQLFKAGGIGCRVTGDIVTARWQKAVWNAAFNPASVLGGAADTACLLATSDAEAFVRRTMQEVCVVAAACGHPLKADVIDGNIERTRAMPPYKTSMALDFEHRRPMETEAILGNTVRAARREGVAIPNLEALYALMQMAQARLTG